MQTFQFPADKVRAAALFAGVKDIRYYLNGLHFSAQAAGAVVTGTDGHRLAAIYHEQADVPPDLDVIIETADIERAVKAHGRSRLDMQFQVLPLVEEHDRAIQKRAVRIIVDGGRTVIECREIEGKFPDWRTIARQALDSKEPPAPCAFNGDYLATYAKLHKILGRAYPAVHVLARGENTAIVDCGYPDVFSVLMPMRGEPAAGAPAWMSGPVAPLPDAPAAEPEELRHAA